ncbi:probable galacturonosyltransferase 15 [Lolium rigidum]|uniref:probable galacturonosyltransferase 15 n=1 Tax=Lolium rigidum TaxID=89674 RepID=UPI001F5CED6F|nr:probable galacturonosyltransferase 15 [Lolium rigidum]
MRLYITAAAAVADDGGLTKPNKAPQQAQAQAARRGCRSAVVTGLLAGLLLFRAALLAVETGASLCPSATGCLGWRAGLGDWLYGGDDPTEEFMKQWRRSQREASLLDPVVVEAAPDSLNSLMAEMDTILATYDRLDMEVVVVKIMAMLLKMDRKVKSSRIQALFNRQLASLGIPKSIHCLALRLAEEFSVNAEARSPVPLPQHAPRLTDTSRLHVALVTDNILAAAVAVASAVSSSADPSRLVFHVVTDKKSYVPMHSWFALHPVSPAIVEVKGLHQFDWRDGDAIASVMRTIDEVQKSSLGYHQLYDGAAEREVRRLEASKPSTFSPLNYLKIHLPEFFPELRRIILLDDDVVVHKDLAGLWEQDLDGNVMGAVGAHRPAADGGICIESALGEHLNFSDPALSSLGLDGLHCAWSWGANIIDLDVWRRTNVTETYQLWLQKNRESEFRLWKMASLPPALIAFNSRVQAIEPLWHLPDLGWRMPDPDLMQFSAVLHFSGPRKPWLEIAFPELRQLWLGHLNVSDSFLRGCGIVE